MLKAKIHGIDNPILGDEFGAMTEEREIRLKKKLVELVNHHTELKAEKKAVNGALNEQIKFASKKIDAIAEAVKKKDITVLQDAFKSEEMYFLDGK